MNLQKKAPRNKGNNKHSGTKHCQDATSAAQKVYDAILLYKKYYKKIYEGCEGKGDFAHMLYTISANLNDDKYKVNNK